MRAHATDRVASEERFAAVFRHLGFITAYARRRGCQDAEAIAAEAMAIAWRRLADIPEDDARPWLIVTARNLLLTEHRRRGTLEPAQEGADIETLADPAARTVELDRELSAALMALSETDREALLLVAWEDLTPALAAASLGVSAAAFRVRLYRARRRLVAKLGARPDTTAGEVTITLRQITGITGLNAKLAAMGTRIRVVPVVPGCVAPVHTVSNGNVLPGPARTLEALPSGGALESMTISADTIPGRTFVVAVSKSGLSEVDVVVVGPAPRCVGTAPGGAGEPFLLFPGR